METDEALATLIHKKDHLNVLRYLRVHQIRDPELTVREGKALLGDTFSRNGGANDVVRCTALEQICLAALDLQQTETVELCLKRLKEVGISQDSARFRILLGRSLEAAEDFTGAELTYDEILQGNPANLMALKRKFCVLKAQIGKEKETMEALNFYLQQNFSDTAAWYEMAKLRKEMGDYSGAAFALEEVLLGIPSDPKIHCELAECYATVGGLENLAIARKHLAQALELQPSNRRAQFGLVSVANAYLEEVASGSKKDFDKHEVAVAKELVKFGGDKLRSSYQGTSMFASVKAFTTEYTLDRDT